MAKRWKLEYFTLSRKETSLHATRDAAMKALYDRLDMAQRDALAFNEQDDADMYGRIRGAMASAWHYATHSKVNRAKGATVWQCDVARIVRA